MLGSNAPIKRRLAIEVGQFLAQIAQSRRGPTVRIARQMTNRRNPSKGLPYMWTHSTLILQDDQSRGQPVGAKQRVVLSHPVYIPKNYQIQPSPKNKEHKTRRDPKRQNGRLNQLPSILGPAPNKSIPYNTSSHPRYKPNREKQRAIPYTHPAIHKNTLKLAMESLDEDLIRKFAGFHTNAAVDIPTIAIPASATASRNWDLCLLTRVCTNKVVFDIQFEKQMRRVWGIGPENSFTSVAKNLYLVELNEKEDFKMVLNGGPWVYRQDLVVLKQCHSSAQIVEKHVSHGEIWVQFHNVTVDSLNNEGMSMLAERVGAPLSNPITGYINGRQFFKVKLLIKLSDPKTGFA